MSFEHGLGTESHDNRDLVNQGYFVCKPVPMFYNRINNIIAHGIVPMSNINRIDFTDQPPGLRAVNYIHLPYEQFRGPLWLFTNESDGQLIVASINNFRPNIMPMKPHTMYGFMWRPFGPYGDYPLYPTWGLYVPLPPLEFAGRPASPPNIKIPNRPLGSWHGMRFIYH